MSETLERLKAALAGRYTVDRELGQGGMATVFLAQDLKHDRDVAIKVLREDLSASLGRERFLAEIKVTAKLAHPNILPLLDSGEADGLLYFVMPYIDGNTLRQRMQRELLLSIDDAVSITGDIADALGYAHAQDVVHRDIKPENILFSGGKAVVADFGIAHAVSEAAGERLTAAGLTMGTPSYMSPEQAAGETGDGRSDEYALACMTYEMLAGEPPYTGPNAQSVLRKHVTDPIPTVRRLRDTVPEEVDAAITKALAKAPADRFSKISQFRSALRDSLLSSSELRTASHSARRFGWVAPVVVITVIVAALGIWKVRGASSPASATALTRVMVLPFSVRGGEDVAYLGDGMVDLLSTKLDGAGNWRSADPRAVLGVVDRQARELLDPASGGDIAGQLGADLYVLGNVIGIGSSVRIDASLYRRGTDEAMIQASVEGTSEEVLALVDELATQLIEGQIGQEGTRLTRLALVTTDSLAALKWYLNGVRHFRAARFPEAWDDFEQAVAVDSAFALAWFQLSVTADWLLQTDRLPWEASERAMRFSDRLSDRDRQLLEAAHTTRAGDVEKAERLYRSLLGSYPDDVDAWIQLGELLFHVKPHHGGSILESGEAWDRVLELEPDQPIVFVHQARLAAVTGDGVALDSLTRLVIELIPEGDRTLEMELLRGLGQRDPEVRRRALDLLRGGSEDALSEAGWSAATFLPGSDGTPALRLMIEPNRSSEMRTVGYQLLAYHALARGRRSASQALIDSVKRFDPVAELEHRANLALIPFAPTDSLTLEYLREELRAFDPATAPEIQAHGVWISVHNGLHSEIQSYLLGLVDASLGRDVEAFHAAGELMAAAAPPTVGSAFADWSRGIRASVAINEGRASDALDQLEEMRLQGWYHSMNASPLLDMARERWLLATALEDAGRTDEALKWYGGFEDYSVYSSVYLAPSHWRRARIYEGRGELGRARQHYEEFVELWDDADLEFRPMVDAAREWVEGFVEER